MTTDSGPERRPRRRSERLPSAMIGFPVGLFVAVAFVFAPRENFSL
jgi:hypothetical protein